MWFVLWHLDVSETSKSLRSDMVCSFPPLDRGIGIRDATAEIERLWDGLSVGDYCRVTRRSRERSQHARG